MVYIVDRTLVILCFPSIAVYTLLHSHSLCFVYSLLAYRILPKRLNPLRVRRLSLFLSLSQKIAKAQFMQPPIFLIHFLQVDSLQKRILLLLKAIVYIYNSIISGLFALDQ